MTGTFIERIDDLIDQIGTGRLVGRVEFNQVYAHYQHEGTEFKHPRGGKSHYLRDPLYDDLDKHMAKLAERLITPDGSQIRHAMVDVVENLAAAAAIQAPREYGDLERSDHPSVLDEGEVIYDRPPHTPRLTEAQLRLKHRGLHHRGSSRSIGIRRRRRLGGK
jgi:hypothetical protein